MTTPPVHSGNMPLSAQRAKAKAHAVIQNMTAPVLRLLVATVLTAFVLSLVSATFALAQTRTLSLYNTHTHERLTVTYKRDGRFVQAGLNQLNRFLRDWRRDEVTRIDPDLFDIVWEVYREVGATEPIHVVSAYRSPATNDMLRRRSSGVARNSQHTQGRAMDFFIPGVQASAIRAAGLRLQQGGVGYYPRSNTPFVHLDTGSVRMWPRMTRSQLQALFPNGQTIHIPADGQPLRGFDIAQRQLQRQTGSTPTSSVASAQNDGDGDIVLPGESGGNFLDALFGGGNRDEAEPTAPAQPVQTQVASLPAQAAPAEEPQEAREPYEVASPVLPPYATVDGQSYAPSTIAGLSVPSPTPAPTIDDIQLAALGRPAPEPSPGAIALDNAFSVASATPQAQTIQQLPPISREEQIDRDVPAPGQIAALIEARFAEQRATTASLTGQVEDVVEVASADAIPGIEAFTQPQESLLTPGRPSAPPGSVEIAETPRFVPPTPLPASNSGSSAPEAIQLAAAPAATPSDQSAGQRLLAAAFAAQQENRTPAQSAIDILTGSTPPTPSQGVTGQLYPIDNDLTAGMAKHSIRGSQHAGLVAPEGTISLSPVLLLPSRFVPSNTFQLRTDGFGTSGS